MSMVPDMGLDSASTCASRVLAEIDALYGAIAGLRCWAFSGSERRSVRDLLCEAAELTDLSVPAARDVSVSQGWRSRLLVHAKPAVDSLCNSPPSVLVKRRVRTPVRLAREFDENSLMRLAARPGATIRDKLAAERSCLSVVRRFSNDVVEFDVIRRLFAAIESSGAAQSDLALGQSDTLWLARMSRNPLVISATPRARLLPTNRLLRDPSASKLWRAFLEARASCGVLAERRRTVARIVAGALRFMIGGCAGPQILHVRPSSFEIDLRLLDAGALGPIEIIFQVSQRTAGTLVFGSIEHVADGGAMFRAGTALVVRVAESAASVVVERDGQIVCESAVETLAALRSVALKVYEIATGLPCCGAVVARRLGRRFCFDLERSSYSVGLHSDRIERLEVPFAAAEPESQPPSGSALGGADAIGWCCFESESTPTWIGSDVLQRSDASVKAALRALADGGDSLVVVTNDDFDPARDSRLIACQPRLTKGLTVVPRSVVAMYSAGLLSMSDEQKPPSAVTVVTLGDRPTVCTFTRELQPMGAGFWIRDPGQFVSRGASPAGPFPPRHWSTLDGMNWTYEVPEPSSVGHPTDAESIDSIMGAIQAVAPRVSDDREVPLLLIDFDGEAKSSLDSDHVVTQLADYKVTRLKWERDLVPAAFQLGIALAGRTATGHAWWCDRRPMLEVLIGSGYVPLFGGSFANEVVQLGHRYVERSREFVLPPMRDQDLRLALRQTLRGRVLSEGSVECRIDEAIAESMRVYIGTEFVYGESSWKLELRRVADDATVPGGVLHFTRTEALPKLEGRNYAPQLAPPTYWSKQDCEEIIDDLKKIRGVADGLDHAMLAWKRSGRKRSDSMVIQALTDARRGLTELDESLRRKTRSSQEQCLNAEVRLRSDAIEFDKWVATAPLIPKLKELVKADASRDREVDWIRAKIHRLRCRIQIDRESAVDEIRRTFETSQTRPEELVNAAELLVACVKPDFSGTSGVLVESFASRFLESLPTGKGHLRSHGARILTRLAFGNPGLTPTSSKRVAESFGAVCETMLDHLASAPDVRYWCLLACRLAVLRMSEHDAVANIGRTSSWASRFQSRWEDLRVSKSEEHRSIASWVRSMQSHEGGGDPTRAPTDACVWIASLLQGTGRVVSLRLPEDLS